MLAGCNRSGHPRYSGTESWRPAIQYKHDLIMIIKIILMNNNNKNK